MKKYYLFFIIFAIQTLCSMDNSVLNEFVVIPKPPSIATFVKASSMVYEDTITQDMLKKAHLHNYNIFIPTNNIKDTQSLGFRSIAFVDHKTKQGIIAYRGTEPKEMGNLLQDIGIFFAEAQKKDPYEMLHTHLNAWLWKYDKKWYAGHKFIDYATWIGKYALYYASGKSWIVKKLTNMVVNHETALRTLSKLLGLSLSISTKSYIKEAIQDAQSFFDDVQAKYPGYYFFITGHSLGGFLAQIVGAKYNQQTYTFNAPGAYTVFNSMYPSVKLDQTLIINFTRENDIFGTFEKHIGSTTTLPNYLDGISMRKSAEVLLAEYEEKQYEQVVQQYWINKQSWSPALFHKVKKLSNPYLHIDKYGYCYFDVHTYLYKETSPSEYVLENHSITNLVYDFAYEEQYPSKS